MTEIILFETNNWHAEGVAILPTWLANHPLMDKALEAISKEDNFDFITYIERESDFKQLFKFIDNDGSRSDSTDVNMEERSTKLLLEIIHDTIGDDDISNEDKLGIIQLYIEELKSRLDFLS